tara:strand:- start:1537 stop:2025 length:489 start_codon:yes stop_codon:yes gene_type:complete
MILILTIAVVILLLFVLSNKFIEIDRGVDTKAVNEEPMPYVTPQVDKDLHNQIKELQQFLVPVQYIDNGLLPKIENSSKKITKALQPEKYQGPTPFSPVSDNQSTLKEFENAKFKDDLIDFQPNILPKVSDALSGTKEIEPYNSLMGMVVSQSQIISSFPEN